MAAYTSCAALWDTQSFPDVTALHILAMTLHAQGSSAVAKLNLQRAIDIARAGYRLDCHERKRVGECREFLKTWR